MQNTALALRRQDPTPARRPSAPRQSLYDNEIHGQGDEEDVARKRRRAAARAYVPQAELLDSLLWARLWSPVPNKNGEPTSVRGAASGVWLPRWVARITGSEMQALVLSHLLWWFQISLKDIDKQAANLVQSVKSKKWMVRKGQKPRPRAQVLDEKDTDLDLERWYAASARGLARHLRLKRKTVEDAIHELVAAGLINMQVVRTDAGGSTGIRLQPVARKLAEAFYAEAHDERDKKIVRSEFPDRPEEVAVPWAGSMTQQLATTGRSVRGVTVHNVFAAIMPKTGKGEERKNARFLARLMSQVVYYHGNPTGKGRAGCFKHGNLWLVKSHEELGDELGVSGQTIKRGIKTLVAAGFLRELKEQYRRNKAGQTRRITHVRPDVEALEAAVEPVLRAAIDEFENEIEEVRSKVPTEPESDEQETSQADDAADADIIIDEFADESVVAVEPTAGRGHDSPRAEDELVEAEAGPEPAGGNDGDEDDEFAKALAEDAAAEHAAHFNTDASEWDNGVEAWFRT